MTPVKGLALHHPDEIVLLRTGAAGDREFFVIDGRDRLISIWKTGRLVSFRAVHDTRSGRITLSSAGDQVCDGPARLAAPVVADFYGRRKVPGTGRGGNRAGRRRAERTAGRQPKPAVTRPGRLDDPPAGVGMLPGDEQVSGHGAGIVAAIRSPR